MAFIGISHSLYKNGCLWINLPRSFDGFGLCGFVITDSGGIRPANCVVAFLFSPFNKHFSAHLSCSSLCARLMRSSPTRMRESIHFSAIIVKGLETKTNPYLLGSIGGHTLAPPRV